jgi:hypothetical protein
MSIKTQFWTIIINLFFLLGGRNWSFSVRVGFINYFLIARLTNDSVLRNGYNKYPCQLTQIRHEVKGLRNCQHVQCLTCFFILKQKFSNLDPSSTQLVNWLFPAKSNTRSIWGQFTEAGGCGDTQMHLTRRLELKTQTRRVKDMCCALAGRLAVSPKIGENLMRLHSTNWQWEFAKPLRSLHCHRTCPCYYDKPNCYIWSY